MRNVLSQIGELVAVACITAGLWAASSHAQSPTPSPDEMKKKVDAYLRNMFAFGPEVKLTVGDFKESGVAGLSQTTIHVQVGDNQDDVTMWVSKDGKYIIRGEMEDMGRDGFAENRAKLQTKDAPSTGAANATVTIVEFADFECPVCKRLHDGMHEVLQKYPQARLVFKDYPIEQIHPWARTGALAGRCAYQQKPAAFWEFYDKLYGDQELISPTNVWDKAVDFAGRAGLNTGAFKACMTSPEATAAVDASIANGKLLEVNSTPTLFVNGRRFVGSDTAQLEKLIQYEVQHASQKTN